MSKPRSIIEAFLKGRFSAMLVSLTLLFLVSPLIPNDQVFAEKIFGVFILVVLASCLKAISHSRKFFIFMVLFTLLNLGVGSFEIFSEMEPHNFKSMVLVGRTLYFIAVFFSIMRYVLDSSLVTGDKICGAISAYMVMGIAWTFVYALFYHLNPESFQVPEEWVTQGINSNWTMYFSFTTLTTLGYGDLVPKTPAAQSYAIMEAACGQIFLTVIIARLIALHIIHERR